LAIQQLSDKCLTNIERTKVDRFADGGADDDGAEALWCAASPATGEVSHKPGAWVVGYEHRCSSRYLLIVGSGLQRLGEELLLELALPQRQHGTVGILLSGGRPTHWRSISGTAGRP
jgi:hypothetical protein